MIKKSVGVWGYGTCDAAGGPAIMAAAGGVGIWGMARFMVGFL